MTENLPVVRSAIVAEVVTFHVRAIRYGVPIRSEEYDDLDEAIIDARVQFNYGESAGQEIWSGDECVLDHDALFEKFLERD